MRHITVVLLIVLAFSAKLKAQDNPSLEPIYLYDGTALWTWTEADGLQQISEMEPDSVLSPDRRWIAYRLSTIEAEKAAGKDMGVSGPISTDIWLFNIESGEHTEVAGHPEDLSYTTVRSSPVWSPDSTQLAWVDGAGVGTLMIYDIFTDETRTVADGLEQTGEVLLAVDLAEWTGGGILKWHEVRDDWQNIIEYEWHFYDPETGDLTIVPISSMSRDATWYLRQGIGDFASINERGAVLTPLEEGWILTSLNDGTPTSINEGRILRYARNNPETSLRIPPGYRKNGGQYQFPVENASGEQVMLLDRSPTLLSPQGDALLTDKRDGTLVISRPGQPDLVIELPWQPNTIYWGETDFELQPGGDTVIFNTTCEGGRLSFRISGGEYAWVLGTTANNVRTEPFRNAEMVGQIKAGDWVTVRQGVRCADGITWWYVDHRSGLEGWTAEGADNEYFLQPGCPPTGCNSD